MSLESNLVENMKNMSLENWDPFYWAAQSCPVLNSPVDWKETPKNHLFIVDLPGVTKDVKIEVLEVLEGPQICGDRGGASDHREAGSEAAKDGDKWHRIERSRGKFCRRFQLPANAKADEVKANMENGVLKVIIPKQEMKNPDKKVIEIEEK
uniref:SHSP domain-containing protein n=2 Tax=Chenopodium quinoa TaxID=63459 RepID=A0A803MY21_CHEQI